MQNQMQLQKVYTLSFTEEEIRILDECLGMGPFRKVSPLVASINQQIKEAQLKEQAAAEAARNQT